MSKLQGSARRAEPATEGEIFAGRRWRKIVFQMAEAAVRRELLRAILEGNGRLRLATATAG
jgi:hypothetical protein